MKKIIIILLLFGFNRLAQADIAEVYFPYGIASEVNYINLNGNLNNLRNVVNGGLDSDNSKEGYNFVEVLSVLPVAGTEGRVVFLTTDDTLNFDDGTQWLTAPTVVGSGVGGDIIYFDGTNWVRLAKGTNGMFLQIGASVPAWSKVDLVDSSNITGTLPKANGGTGNITGQPSGTASGDLAGTYPNPTIAANAIDSTHINTSFMGCFSDVVEDETNTTIIVGDFRNKWVTFQGYMTTNNTEASVDAYIPGGDSDAQALGERIRVAGEDTTPIIAYDSHTSEDMTQDTQTTFFGRFYTESGVTAPATTEAYAPTTPEGRCVESGDRDNDFDSDCFLYASSTTGYLMLHIGTALNYVAFSIQITVLPNTAL